MSGPIVSVIIPVHDRIELLMQAVASVRAQTYQAFELIVVDDGSRVPVASFLPKPEGIPPEPAKIVRIEHCGLPGQVRNEGARRARGRFLAFLDSDDLWLTEKLFRQVEWHLGHPEIPISHTREIWIRGEREISQKGQRHRRAGDIFTDALKKCIIGPSTTMIERSLFESVGGFRDDLEIAEDYELWLRITDRFPVGYIDEALTVKRAGHSQLSEKYGQIENFRIAALQRLVDREIFTVAHRPEAREELSRKCAIYAAGCRKRGRTEDAAHYESLARVYR
jgi:glycosyltransferase involved in cell wall biosynthesis